MSTIRAARAAPTYDLLDERMASLVKGMLLRGDKQSDIAACFLLNIGRVSEINTGERFADAPTAPAEGLPPPPPYVSPYELWTIRQELLCICRALEAVRCSVDGTIGALKKAAG
jgi:hypothetical protein